MSLNLLSTAPGGSSRFSKRYINDGASSSTDRACFSSEYDRVIYMGIERTSTSPHQFHMNSFNIQSGEVTYLGYVTKAQLNNQTNKNIQGFLCDGRYGYITMYSGVHGIFRIDMKDLNKTAEWYPATRNFTCYTRCYWYDDKTIVMMDVRGLAYFHTDTLSWTYESYKSSDTSNRQDFAWCDKGIADTYQNLAWYNRETQTYRTFNLPTSTYYSLCCYGEGKIWVVNQAYVFSFDVETETWDSEYTPVPFGAQVKYVCYTDNLLYIILNNSNKLWVFETQRKKFAYLILPWTLINNGDIFITIATYHRYAFMQYWSFGVLNYEGLYKYNIGYKIIQYSIPFSEDLLDYHEKDPCLIPTPSYLTFEQVDDTIEASPIESGSTIKSAHVNKKDYKTIKKIQVI